MKKKNGFVSMSLVYAFFIVFVAIMLSVLATYAQNRVLNNAINENIMENIADNREALCNYEENSIIFERSLDPDEEKNYNEKLAEGQIHGQLKIRCNGYYKVELIGHSGKNETYNGKNFYGGLGGDGIIFMKLNAANELVYNLNYVGPNTISYLYQNERVTAMSVTNGSPAETRRNGVNGYAEFAEHENLLYQYASVRENEYSKIIISYLGVDAPRNKIKTWEKVNDQGNIGVIDQGDEFRFDMEHFYVIDSDDEYTILFAKYNLLVGYQNNTGVETLLEDQKNIQDETARGYLSGTGKTFIGTTPFTNSNYWVKEGSLNSKYGLNYPAYVYDKNSLLKKYLDNYEAYLERMGAYIDEIRLIKYEELLDLGCTNTNCNDAPNWVSYTSFWTGTAKSNDINSIYSVKTDKSLGTSENPNLGVRPVIIVPTSYLE